jgi:hypothetical protein
MVQYPVQLLGHFWMQFNSLVTSLGILTVIEVIIVLSAILVLISNSEVASGISKDEPRTFVLVKIDYNVI